MKRAALARQTCYALLLASALPGAALSQTAPTAAQIVRTLSAPELQGRGADTEGLAQSQEIIVGWLRAAGLEPAGSSPGSYLSPFKATTAIALNARQTELKLGEHVLALGLDFIPASFSDDVAFEGDAITLPTGLSLPQHQHDDYAQAQVKGRLVLMPYQLPEAIAAKLSAQERYLLEPSSRAAVALSHGASAVGFILPNDRLPRLRPQPALTGLGVIYIMAKSAQRLSASPTPARLSLALKRQTQTLNNCIAKLPNSAKTHPQGPIYLVAHYDGLGLGYTGTSFAQQLPQLHPGANDNASGVALMLLTAAALTQGSPLARPVYLMLLSGEELGLGGARHEAMRLAPGQGALVINADMVGKLHEHALIAASSDPTSTVVGALTAAAQRAQLTLDLSYAPDDLHSDHIAFSEAGFRVLHLQTGRPGDYHLPADDIEGVSIAGVEQLAALLVTTLRALATNP